MLTAVLRTRLETSVLGYDHIPDAWSNLLSLTVAQQSISNCHMDLYLVKQIDMEWSYLTMYPDAEDEIKIEAWKNVLSSLYEHVRTCKICHTYLNAILEHAVKNKK